jgi:hypothetical protein
VAEPWARSSRRRLLSTCLPASVVTAHGIRTYAPHIHLERARLAELVKDDAGYEDELRQAHQLFLDVGAHGRADEVAAMVRSG